MTRHCLQLTSNLATMIGNNVVLINVLLTNLSTMTNLINPSLVTNLLANNDELINP